MGRFKASIESQTAQLAGNPSGTTFNGYFAAVVAGASANFKLRRATVGVRAGASVPTSQQMTIVMYRQTVRASGTGLTNVVGTNMDMRGAASATGGVDFTTAATAGTTGPTVTTASNASVGRFSFNTQSAFDIPWELLEEMVCDQGTANGIAFVNIGNALPASHLFSLDLEWEE